MTVSKTKPTQIINRNIARHPLRWVGLKLANLADKEQHPKLAKAAKVLKWGFPPLAAIGTGLAYHFGTGAPIPSDLLLYSGIGGGAAAAVDVGVVLGVGRAAAREELRALEGAEGADVQKLQKENKELHESYDAAMAKIEQMKEKHRQLLRAMQKQEEVDLGRLERIDLEKHYGIREMLAEGGYGKVLRGYDKELQRPVVIKTLKDELARDKEIVTRFVREARIIASLDKHSNIARIHRVGKVEKDIVGANYRIRAGIPCFIMEYVEGMDLGNYIHKRGGRLPVAEAIRFATEIIRALKYAHENGIVHRDVKPENAMVTKDGEIKMIDFGIAKGGKGKSLTQENRILGTAQYMSPEQIRGIKEEIDYRTDIYAVGVMLFEMIEGKMPFGDCGETPNEIMAYMARACKIPILDVLAQTQYVPENLKDFISGTMEPNPGQRWVDHDDLIEFLERQGTGYEQTAVGPNPLLQGGA